MIDLIEAFRRIPWFLWIVIIIVVIFISVLVTAKLLNFGLANASYVCKNCRKELYKVEKFI